jgi:uncharacterized protein (DUF58 family)
MSISGIFGRNNLLKLDVDVGLPQEIYARTELPVRVTIRNARRFLPAFLIRLKIGDTVVFFPFVDAKGESTRYVSMTFPNRGRSEMEGLYIWSPIPFGFFTRYRRLNNTFQFVVFPQLRKCELAALCERGARSRGEKTSDKIGYESDLISIRKYVYGDPLKYISWKATAKTGDLKIKELSSLIFEPIVIHFEEVDIKDLEEKISCIAYTIFQFLRKNIPVGLEMKGTVYGPGTSKMHKINMLTELALHETARGKDSE